MTHTKFACSLCGSLQDTTTDVCPECGVKCLWTLQKPFVIWTGGHVWHKPDYHSFDLIWATDEEDASNIAWEICEDEASSCDRDTEECDNCQGEGCEDCDGEGVVDVYEWSEHVEDNTSRWVEEYDPEKHFEVKSDFPEHKEYKHKHAVDCAMWRLTQATRKLEEARAAAARAQKDVDKFTKELEKLDAQS